MLSCTTNPRFVGISQRADGSLHSAVDSVATSGLPGFFLSALRFMIAVIFKGLHRTLTASCGDLPDRAPAFASPDVVHSGLVMRLLQLQLAAAVHSLCTSALREVDHERPSIPLMWTRAMIKLTDLVHRPGNAFSLSTMCAASAVGSRPSAPGLNCPVGFGAGRLDTPKCPAWRPNCLAIWAQQAQLGSGASLGGQA